MLLEGTGARSEGEMDIRKCMGARTDRFRSDTRKRMGEMLSNASEKIDGKHLSSPLRRTLGMV
jgi:hypothetical protein